MEVLHSSSVSELSVLPTKSTLNYLFVSMDFVQKKTNTTGDLPYIIPYKVLVDSHLVLDKDRITIRPAMTIILKYRFEKNIVRW